MRTEVGPCSTANKRSCGPLRTPRHQSRPSLARKTRCTRQAMVHLRTPSEGPRRQKHPEGVTNSSRHGCRESWPPRSDPRKSATSAKSAFKIWGSLFYHRGQHQTGDADKSASGGFRGSTSSGAKGFLHPTSNGSFCEHRRDACRRQRVHLRWRNPARREVSAAKTRRTQPAGLLLDAQLPDNLATRIADGAMHELLEARRELARQHVEILQDPNDGRELRALRPVFDLDRDT